MPARVVGNFEQTASERNTAHLTAHTLVRHALTPDCGKPGSASSTKWALRLGSPAIRPRLRRGELCQCCKSVPHSEMPPALNTANPPELHLCRIWSEGPRDLATSDTRHSGPGASLLGHMCSKFASWAQLDPTSGESHYETDVSETKVMVRPPRTGAHRVRPSALGALPSPSSWQLALVLTPWRSIQGDRPSVVTFFTVVYPTPGL